MNKLRLLPKDIQPGDVILFFGRLRVLTEPEPRAWSPIKPAGYYAVGVEGVDGAPSIQYFEIRHYTVERPDTPAPALPMSAAQQGEREWEALNLADPRSGYHFADPLENGS